MNESAILEISELCKCHRTKRPFFRAEISKLCLFHGQVLGITGTSGCGKSTLLEMLALLTQPTTVKSFFLRTSEQIFDLAQLWENNPRELERIRRLNLGFVHQTGSLYPFLTVYENILLPLKLNSTDEHSLHMQRVKELLTFLGLEHVAHNLPETLSFGERQRTAIARALVHRPVLVLADEPTSALDPESARLAMNLLREGVQSNGSALVVVSHDHKLLEDCHIPACSMQRGEQEDDERAYFFSLSSLPTEQKEQVVCSKKAPTFSLRVLFLMAWKDFKHEAALSLCAILAFAAALTPVMTLVGLSNGVVTILSNRLLQNPAALAVNPYGSRRYTDADLAELALLPAVNFIVPMTRTLASSVEIERQGKRPLIVDVLPTASGDPLLLRYASIPDEGTVVLTRETARSLEQAEIGQEIEFKIRRRFQDRDEYVTSKARIQAILPDAADWKARLYLPLSFLLDMERYRDGFAVESRKWPGEIPKHNLQSSYAGFRMYVNNLEAVIPVRDALKQRGIDAYTFAREVETLQYLHKALTFIILLVGGVTVTGMAFSLISLVAGNIRRKARLFAQDHLLGFMSWEMILQPLLQMAFVALAAATLSLLLYSCVANLLDLVAGRWLEKGENACNLSALHIVFFYGGSFVLSFFCAIVAGRRLLKIRPAEELRREA